jgi:hypothetical protein
MPWPTEIFVRAKATHSLKMVSMLDEMKSASRIRCHPAHFIRGAAREVRALAEMPHSKCHAPVQVAAVRLRHAARSPNCHVEHVDGI